MIHEEQSRQVVMVTFRGMKFGSTEMYKMARAVISKMSKGETNGVKHGKMKLKDLMEKDQGATAMEVKEEALKGFEKFARKYGIDFAVTKDKTKDPPVYQVFFKGRDQDTIAKAFNDYVSEYEARKMRPSLAMRLRHMKAKADMMNAQLQQRVKNLAKGRSL